MHVRMSMVSMVVIGARSERTKSLGHLFCLLLLVVDVVIVACVATESLSRRARWIQMVRQLAITRESVLIIRVQVVQNLARVVTFCVSK